MTDHPEKDAGPEMEGPGVQLRRAREARGLLLHDIAQELHLDEWMLKALEEDDFPALGAPVFAKGHMRKYGSMLGLDTDDLMIAYYRKRGRDDSPPPITRMQRAERRKPRVSWQELRWVLAVLVAAIVLWLLWGLISRSGPPDSAALPEEPTVSPGSSPPVTITSVSEDLADSGEPDDAADISDTIPAAIVPAAERAAIEAANEPQLAVASVAEAEVQAVREVELRISVSDDSWVEVTDSNGTRLIYDMMIAGRSRTVSGQPPVEVFLGLSRSVRLDVDGQFYPVPRRAVRGNTARFVIDPETN
ncbi:MAG: DUF4115 domain-containing protein [Gammaproteobacteria bacterium]|nr:DUF4115 domain-containing protein [Gammaproteobacteria bacterium]MDH3768340.1 DUF4115 domain-containing protein [Gammaproteobacteria bacterium]